MAEKGFGVKEINLVGATGTPTIESPGGNLNLNANNVAISTNASVGGTLSVTGNISVGGTLTYAEVTDVDSLGIITARTGIKIGPSAGVGGTFSANGSYITTGIVTAFKFVGDGSGLTGVSGASGSGLAIRDSGSTVGTAGTINFRNNLTVSSFTGGTATVDATAPDPTNSDIQVVYTVTANGFSAYRFAGNGVVSSTDNPDLYLYRGTKYRFINNSGGSHPFEIRASSGGSAYNTGVTNNGASSGNIDFAVPYNAPNTLVYQCTSHGGMVGTINIVQFSSSSSTSRNVVSGSTGSLAQNAIGNITITGHKSYLLMNVGLSTAGWFRLYTDSASRTSDASRSVGEDPTPGSGVIAEVVTTGISTSIKISPFVPGGNMDSTPSTNMYVAIQNLSSTTQAITANLTILKLED